MHLCPCHRPPIIDVDAQMVWMQDDETINRQLYCGYKQVRLGGINMEGYPLDCALPLQLPACSTTADTCMSRWRQGG